MNLLKIYNNISCFEILEILPNNNNFYYYSVEDCVDYYAYVKDEKMYEKILMKIDEERIFRKSREIKKNTFDLVIINCMVINKLKNNKLKKFIRRVRPYGYLMYYCDDGDNEKERIKKYMREGFKLVLYSSLNNMEIYLWIRNKKERIIDIYYIGNEKCEIIKYNTEKEIMEKNDKNIELIGYDKEIKDKEGIIYLNYGVVYINKVKMRVIKKIEKIELNPPIIIENIKTEIKNFKLISDHYLPGGTKQRGIDLSKINEKIIVYPGPYIGYAQISLAIAAKIYNKKAVMFIVKQDTYTTLRAMQYGLKVKIYPNVNLKNLQDRAVKYCEKKKAYLFSFGFNSEEYIDNLANNISYAFKNNKIINNKEYNKTIWVTCGSCTLLKSLYKVFPKAKFSAIQVGKEITDEQIDKTRTTIYIAPEFFYNCAKILPPYPSAKKYDAKLWQFVIKYGNDGDVIWNVAN